MSDFVDKLSSYDIFNHLLPGTVFVAGAAMISEYSFIQEHVLIGVFVYYFIGLVISRFGSLVVEPLFRKISFVNFASYSDFVSASEKDPKIEVLSEVNNTYRTICSMFILLGALRTYQALVACWPRVGDWGAAILYTLLVVLFVLSYRKQTDYVAKRVGRRAEGA